MLAGFHFSALVFLFFFFSIQFSPKIKMSPHGTHHICERCRESYCYYLMLFSRKKQLFISYFFYTAQKPLFKIISHSEKGFLVFNHIVALNVSILLKRLIFGTLLFLRLHRWDPFCGSFILDQAGVNTMKFSIFQLSPILHIFALL